ncbi:MAG: hypothetical protein AAFX05_05380 [Planctomycetota bacterium]
MRAHRFKIWPCVIPVVLVLGLAFNGGSTVGTKIRGLVPGLNARMIVAEPRGNRTVVFAEDGFSINSGVDESAWRKQEGPGCLLNMSMRGYKMHHGLLGAATTSRIVRATMRFDCRSHVMVDAPTIAAGAAAAIEDIASSQPNFAEEYFTEELREPDVAHFEGFTSIDGVTIETRRESIHWPGWIYNVLFVGSLLFATSTLPFWPWREKTA